MLKSLLLAFLASAISHATPITFDSRLHDKRAEAEPEILKPRARSDRRRDDWEDLIPKTAQELYFASGGPTVEHKFADVTANFTGKAVVLEKSDFVQDVKCLDHAIDVTFSEEEAYNFVKKQWNIDIMLVTNSDTCGALTEERSFWDVTELHFGEKLTVRASVREEKAMYDAIDSVSLLWGTWTPPPTRPKVHHRDLVSREPELQVRGPWDWFKRTVNKVVEVGHAAGKAVLQTVGDGIKAGVNAAVNLAAEILSFKPSLAEKFPIDVRPETYESSPPVEGWDKSWELYSAAKQSANGVAEGNLRLYCVDCHLTGYINLEGAADFNVKDGLKTLYAQADANFQAQVALGLVADAQVKKAWDKEIFKKNIPKAGFHVKGIITIGCFVEARAKAEIGLSVQGNVLAGLKMTECKFNTRLDLKDASKSQPVTFQPKFEPIFRASGEVVATAGVSLPVALGVGVEIPAINLDATVLIVEQPGVNAKAEWTGSVGQEPETGGDPTDTGTDPTDPESPTEGNNDDPQVIERSLVVAPRAETCAGVKFEINFVNDVYLDYGLTKTDRRKFEISHVKVPIDDRCFETRRAAEKSARSLTLPARDEIVNDPNDPFDGANAIGGWDAQDYAEMEQEQDEAIDSVEASLESGEYPDGTEFITIKDSSGKYQLIADDAGALRPGAASMGVTGGNMFAEDEGVVYADYSGRILRYTSLAMRLTGVSDIGLTKAGVQPADSNFIALVPAPIGGGKYAYAAITLDGKVFTVLTCNYKNAPSRLWLVKNQKTGEKLLKASPSLLTGGKITSCANLQWSVGPAYDDGW